MLTNKGKYGLKALAYLAEAEPGTPVMATEIASRNNIPKKFLDGILAELRRAGVVRSKKGRAGGYELAQPPDKILVSKVMRVLDGPLAPFRCASHNYYERCQDCEIESECPVHRLMVEMRNAIVSVTDHQTLADLPIKSKGKRQASGGTKAISRPEKKALPTAIRARTAKALARPGPRSAKSTSRL